MKKLVDDKGKEFQVTDGSFKIVKEAFSYGSDMVIIDDISGNTHSVLESDNKEVLFYSRNYN